MTASAQTIQVVCRQCRLTVDAPRQSCDYPEAVRLEGLCPECCGGDFSEDFYYDSAGKHITRDPDRAAAYAREKL